MSEIPEKPDPLVLNHLLAALPHADRRRWAPHLEAVTLHAGQVLHQPGSAPAFVYFPTSAVISLMSTTLDGASTELAIVGPEGMAGIAVLMGGSTMFSQAVVQAAGQALRLPSHALRGELRPSGAVLAMLLRYTQAVMVHLAQTALCNRYHSIDQQLSKRLLQALDRSSSAELAMTQESAANLLGVRREGITAAASRLQHAGIIRYHRGQIAVLDRARLEQSACECYASARNEHQRLLPALGLPPPLPSSAPAPAPRAWASSLAPAA